MTSSPIVLRDQFARIGNLVRNAVRLLREASCIWFQTMQIFWKAPGLAHKLISVVMLMVTLVCVLCLAYFLLLILPWIILGTLLVIFIRAVGRNIMI